MFKQLDGSDNLNLNIRDPYHPPRQWARLPVLSVKAKEGAPIESNEN